MWPTQFVCEADFLGHLAPSKKATVLIQKAVSVTRYSVEVLKHEFLFTATTSVERCNTGTLRVNTRQSQLYAFPGEIDHADFTGSIHLFQTMRR